MEIKELLKVLQGKTAPTILTDLINFDNTVSKDDWFSEGFEFFVDEENHLLITYSEDVELLNGLIQFAEAESGGSTYAFWIRDHEAKLDDALIVALGGEGGTHVVAENIKDLFKILTYDVSPMVDDESVSYYKDEDHEASKYSSEYKTWLADNYDISSITNADEIVKKAQEKYQDEYKAWFDKFFQ